MKSTTIRRATTSKVFFYEVDVFRREHIAHRKRFVGYAHLQCMHARRKFHSVKCKMLKLVSIFCCLH